MPENRRMTMNQGKNLMISIMLIVISLSINALNEGRTAAAITAANTNAIMIRISDSPINCPISCFRNAPTTFLIPTSFERFEAWAVARFM